MRLSALILLVCLTIAQSCGSKGPAEVENLHEQVMVVHDEVMPKMSDINRAKKKLRKIKDPSLNEDVLTLLTDLENADEAMMSWMHDYKKPSGEDLEAAKKYLNDQLVKITEVKDVMLSSIANAEKFIAEHAE